ncbi:MAG: zinc ribbon domain-containing protein [Synergistaceae bacterium]|jgi:uncharacterized Zn finger protein (UPF0148 family)|nr:zinc ribbon domain-containing protein [Synergistaceae bacterium]
MSVRFCQKCGITVDEGDVYCHSCGTDLKIKIPDGASESSEIAEYCARCGLPVYAGDRFCSNCGTDRAARPEPRRVHDKSARDEHVASRGRRRLGIFKITLAILFWGSILAGCYAAYRYLGRDIPWGEVTAVMTGRRGSAVSGDIPSADTGAALPPIAPETASSDAPARQDPEPTPVKLAWGAQDEIGISVLVLSDGAPASDLLSLPGSVTGSRVRLRAEPSTMADILNVLEKGDGVDIMKRFSSENEKFVWYNVRAEKGSGWIYGEFVRVIEDE